MKYEIEKVPNATIKAIFLTLPVTIVSAERSFSKLKLIMNKTISMIRGMSPLSEFILRENQVEQVFCLFEENLERDIISFFVKISFYRISTRLF